MTTVAPSPFAQMLADLAARYPNYTSVWKKSREEFGEQWERDISANISAVFGAEPNAGWSEAVEGYAEFCTEALRAQVFFERYDRYKATNYEEVVKSCYHSPEYMKQRYLPGQYLSHYIWPHHCKMLHHYLQDLLPRFGDEVKLFYEVGVGCGMYSQKTLEYLPEARGVGYDISPYALEFTERVVRQHGYGDRFEVRNQDIIANPIEKKADLIINQEVLEHLENPAEFIRGLWEAVRPGGWGYITAAVNAAHTDHIYRYNNPGEVRRQIEDAGWEVLEEKVEFNYPEKPEKFRPTVAAFLTRKPGPAGPAGV